MWEPTRCSGSFVRASSTVLIPAPRIVPTAQIIQFILGYYICRIKTLSDQGQGQERYTLITNKTLLPQGRFGSVAAAGESILSDSFPQS
jgi:hypothetical protein